MNVRIEEMRGIEACRVVESAHPEGNVLMRTFFNEEAAVTTAVMTGAWTYRLTNVGFSEWIKAIQGVGGRPEPTGSGGNAASEGEIGSAKCPRGSQGSRRAIPT